MKKKSKILISKQKNMSKKPIKMGPIMKEIK